MYSKNNAATEVLGADFIWRDGVPKVLEFIEYLDNPVTVGNIPSCLKEEIKTIPAFKDDYLIAFKDVFLEKDPYREAINKKRQVVKQKIYPNAPCHAIAEKNTKSVAGDRN